MSDLALFQFEMSADMHERITSYARQRGMTLTEYVKRAVAAYALTEPLLIDTVHPHQQPAKNPPPPPVAQDVCTPPPPQVDC